MPLISKMASLWRKPTRAVSLDCTTEASPLSNPWKAESEGLMSSSPEHMALTDSPRLPSFLDTNNRDKEHRTAFSTRDDTPIRDKYAHTSYYLPSFWMMSTFVLLVVVGFQAVLLLSGGQQTSPPGPIFSHTGETDFGETLELHRLAVSNP